ncbi:MAG TPA: hypothetical protein VF668_04620, partial [Pyrinomonadaceae bacterium]
MSHEERRTPRVARPISLSVLVALALAASSCGGGREAGPTASRSGANANAAGARGSLATSPAQPAPAAADLRYWTRALADPPVLRLGAGRPTGAGGSLP